ncbi:MAG: Ig-like domain-containing protein, partial [Gammaproteobacteria bacterium]|nr:Ig-like domain-containing protein [Gammaproteobacteria bacterium]
FTYTVSSGAATDTATVTVTVVAFGANDDTATTRSNVPVTINVLANDVGFTAPVTVTKTDGTNGTVVVNGSPGNLNVVNVTYTPAANFVGTDTFTYTVVDGASAPTDTATVTVTVTNEVPTAGPGTINSISTAGFDPATRSGTFNAATGNNVGDPPSVVTASGATRGSTSIAGTTVTYTPSATFFQGSDTFSYTITDSDDETATNTVTVNIADALPTLTGASISTTAGTASAPRTLAFTLGNGAAAQHTLAVTTAAGNGSCALSGATPVSGTTLTYTPNAGYTGSDSCVVTITDENGSGDAATGTFTVTVSAAPGGGGGAGGLLPGGSGAFDPWSLAFLAGLPLLGRFRGSRRGLAAGNR